MEEIICEKNKCSQCCMHAAVPLLNEDVNRIILLGFYDAYFVNEDSGVKLMRTWSDGRCIFFDKDNGGCEIYPHRPEQCKQRPYTIRNDSHKPGIDEECIHCKECTMDPAEVKKMARYFKKLKEEIEWRRKTGYF